MLDYDASIPIQSNVAYPVFFKLQIDKMQKQRKKPGVSPMKIKGSQPIMNK